MRVIVLVLRERAQWNSEQHGDNDQAPRSVHGTPRRGFDDRRSATLPPGSTDFRTTRRTPYRNGTARSRRAVMPVVIKDVRGVERSSATEDGSSFAPRDSDWRRTIS
jgi:hypothetical protein